MRNLEIQKRRVDHALVLDLTGKLKLGEGSAELHAVIRSLVENGEKYILVNLANVSYIDSSGLGELVAGYTALKRVEGDLKLLHLTTRARELMTMTKLLTVFDVYESESEAIGSFQIMPEITKVHQASAV